MIRRNWTAADGTPSWLLIPQIQHAQLAGRLADNWSIEPFATVAERPEVSAAITHHDDGWAEWEESPGVDSDLGRPLSFMEMPLAESLTIWSASIARATQFGHLARWMVASHFIGRLLQSSMASSREARDWVAAMRGCQANSLAAWQAEAPVDNTLAVASQAVAYMQLFDALSLWFCTAERTRPHRLATPEGLMLRLTPQPAGVVTVAPWPLRTERLDLTVCGAAVPVARYGGSADLVSAPRTQVKLAWRVAAE